MKAYNLHSKFIVQLKITIVKLYRHFSIDSFCRSAILLGAFCFKEIRTHSFVPSAFTAA